MAVPIIRGGYGKRRTYEPFSIAASVDASARERYHRGPHVALSERRRFRRDDRMADVLGYRTSADNARAAQFHPVALAARL